MSSICSACPRLTLRIAALSICPASDAGTFNCPSFDSTMVSCSWSPSTTWTVASR